MTQFKLGQTIQMPNVYLGYPTKIVKIKNGWIKLQYKGGISFSMRPSWIEQQL